MVKLIRIKSDIRREGTNVVSTVIDVGMRGPRRPPVQCCDYCCTHGAAGYCHIVTSIWSSAVLVLARQYWPVTHHRHRWTRLDRLVQCQQPPCIRLDWQPQWTNDVRTLLMTSMTVQGLHVPALRMRTVLFLWSPGGLSAARGGECSAMLDTDTEVPGLGC